jgi:hypothetical protein
MRLAALRSALLPVAVAAALLSGAPAAGAQTVGTYYAPSCGPGTPCTLLRFQLTNPGASALLLNSLTLVGSSAPFRFAPSAGGVSLYQAVDAVGAFGGSATVAPGGAQLFIDFLGGNGFAFELNAGTVGYVEVPLTQTPALGGAAYTFAATLGGGGTVSGSISVIPEPATIVLLGSGLALVGLATRRRRRA